MSTLLKAADNLSSFVLLDSDLYETALKIRTLNPSIQLQYLNCDGPKTSGQELLILLRQCKETIRYLFIDIDPFHDSNEMWLYVLYNIHKHLELLDFEFRWEVLDHVDDWYDGMLEEADEYDDEMILAYFALGDIQRQVNANRLAAGLQPHPTSKYERLALPPLKSVMRESLGKKLDSKPWYPID